jgi:hypothetical protein
LHVKQPKEGLRQIFLLYYYSVFQGSKALKTSKNFACPGL